jgi:aminoglycoside phosphotransferase (APT) family kinase protein
VAPPPVSVDAVLDGPRPGRGDPAADANWLSCRRDLAAAACGGAFDPRMTLALDAQQLDTWRGARRVWATHLFADDPRVTACRA